MTSTLVASDCAALDERTTRGLYAQATAAMLDRKFPSSRIEYLLLDARSGDAIALRWPRVREPIPPGSLLKPFLALAYERDERSSTSPPMFPKIHCHGKADGCWSAAGHGLIGLKQALAVSCNAYFLALSRELVASRGNALQEISAAYGISEPPSSATPSMLIGVTPDWLVPPSALAEAYRMLMSDRGPVDSKSSEGRVEACIRKGMRMAVLPGGTAARVGVHAGGGLAKTGTAPCVPESRDAGVEIDGNRDRCRINGDGLVVLAAPAEHPRWVLLVRKRGTTGAMTAEVAGRMLTSLEEADGFAR